MQFQRLQSAASAIARPVQPMARPAQRFLGKTMAICMAACLAPAALAMQIVVGQVAPLSGLDANQGRAYSAGMQLYFNTVNKAGGVNGHTFTLVRKDDGGRSDDTVALAKQMIAEDRPMVLGGFFGTRNIAELAASGILEKERIALVGYRSAEIRAETPYLYSVRAGLREEISKITEHLATIGINRLGLLYEDTPSARALLDAAEEAAKKSRATLVAKAAYPAGTARVSPAVNAFMATPPQAIIMVASGAAAAGFIEQYRSAGGTAQLFANSEADIEQLAKRLAEEQMQGVVIAQVTPSPYKIAGRIAKEFNDTVAKTPNLEVPMSYAMMEGYITARVIVEAVRRQGARPTREGMAATLDNMDYVDLGGYVVGFKPNMRTGSRFVEMSIISGAGKIRQ